jgi:hypothetical protein
MSQLRELPLYRNPLASAPLPAGRSSRTRGAFDGPVIPFVDVFIGPFASPLPLVDRAGAVAPTILANHDESINALVSETLFLVSMTYTQTVTGGGGNDLTLTILDPTWEQLENLLFTFRDDFSVQFGWRSPQGVISTPRIPLLITDWEIDLQPFRGAEITIIAMDRSVLLTQHVMETTHFPPAMLISTAIEQTVLEGGRINGKFTILPSGSAGGPVEASRNVLGNDHNRPGDGNRTPMAYLRHLMGIYRSATTSSKNQLVFIVEADPTRVNTTIMRFIPWELRSTIQRTYVFGRDRLGEMLSFSPKYSGIFVASRGGRRLEGLAVDGRAKSGVAWGSDPSEDLLEAALTDYPTEPHRVSRVYTLPWTDPDDMEAFIQARRSAADLVYDADAAIMGDPYIQPLDQIQINVLSGSGDPGSRTSPIDKLHVTSGVYTIYGVVHTVAPGSFRTTLSLQRRASSAGTAQEGTPLLNFDEISIGSGGYSIPVSTIA